MILVGWSTAAALLIPGIWGALLAVVLGQLQMLVDCCDGEVARWRRTSSPAGVFLDKVGHYTTEALIPLALGHPRGRVPARVPGRLPLDDARRAARARDRAQQGAQRHGARRPRQRRAAEARRHPRRDRAPRRPRRDAPQGGALPAVPPALPLGRADASSRSPPPSSGSSSASRSSTASCSSCCVPARAPRRWSGTSSRSWPQACPFLTRQGRGRRRTPRSASSCSRRAPGRTTSSAASASVLAQQGVDARRRVRRQRLGAGPRTRPAAACKTARTCPRTSASRPGATAGVARGRAATYSSSSTTTRACPIAGVPRRRDRACCAARPEHRPASSRASSTRRARSSPRRWIPRIRKGDAAHSSNVFSVWEGAVLLPRRRVRRDRRLGRPVLLRARGHRAGLAGLGHRACVAWYAGDLDGEPSGHRRRPGTRTTTG